MSFREAYEPFRALGSSFRLIQRAPISLLLGAFVLFLVDFGAGSVSYSVEHHRLEPEEAALILILVGAGCGLGIILWLFSCLVRIGFATAVQRALDGQEDRVGALLEGQGRWISMVFTTLLQWILRTAVLAAGVVFVLPAVLLGAAVAEDASLSIGLGFLAGVLYLPVAAWFWLGLSLMEEAVAVEGLAPLDAVARSWTLVRGNRLALFWYKLVVNVFALLGLLACCVGVIATSLPVYVADYDAYLRLVRPDEEQGGW